MRVSLKSVLAAAVAMAAAAMSSSAATVPISSTVGQSGFNGDQTNSTAYPLTATPFDFTGQVNSFGSITSVDSLTITLEMNDGDSNVGDFDFNNLTLGLDGHDTGVKLNGFTNGQILTLTVGPLPVATQLQLIADLADGKVAGSVIAGPNSIGPVPPGDTIGFPAAIDTTLDLVVSGANLLPGTNGNGGGGNPVPLPAGVLVAPLGAGLAGIYARRFRSKK